MSDYWVNFAMSFGTVLACWITWYLGVSLPKKKGKARIDQKHLDDLALIDGVKAIPGVIDEVPPAALRIHALEDGFAEVSAELAALASQVAGLAEFQRLANGTSSRIEEMLNELIKAKGEE